MKRWVAAMEPTVRETFVDALFDVLGATSAGTLEELSERWWESAGAVLAALKDLDDETRRALTETFGLLVDAVRQTMPELLPKSPPLPRLGKRP